MKGPSRYALGESRLSRFTNEVLTGPITLNGQVLTKSDGTPLRAGDLAPGAEVTFTVGRSRDGHLIKG